MTTTLLDRLAYQAEVNRLLIDRGRDAPIMTAAELHAMAVAFELGDSPNVFAATLPDVRPDGTTDLFALRQQVLRAEAAERRVRHERIVDECDRHGMSVVAESVR